MKENKSIENENYNILEDVGDRIRECRKAAKLSQKQLSEKTGITKNHISRLERGLHTPHFDILIKIAKVLDVPIDAFVKDLSSDNINIFWENIKNDVNGMSKNQLFLIKDIINAIKKYKF